MSLLRCGLPLLASLLLVACGGGGEGASVSSGAGSAGGGGGGTGGVGNVTISGTVTYERVGFAPGTSTGLDLANALPAPVRGASVEALAPNGQTVLATATTSATGAYSVTVPRNTDLFIRVRAELLRTGTPAWTVTVRDNTAGAAVYTLDGSVFNAGTVDSTRNLAARTGWTAGSGYTGPRAAAPFSILDAVYEAQQLVLSADANAVFPELRLFWSPNNLPCSPGANDFCNGSSAALGRGEIGTSFFTPGTPDRIFVLGAANIDTDEFDQHVIAHEWGHYYQDNFSRDDSLGGEHSTTERLDLRVAFSEGWSNAFAGMVRNDPVYRDSFDTNQARGFAIDVEANNNPNAGWFNEGSIQSILWDLYDSTADGVDGVSLGFGPLHAVMTGRIRTTAAFTSVYPLLEGLRLARPADTAAINALAGAQLIATHSDDFGDTETNAGLDARNLPIYRPVVGGQTVEVCSSVPTADGVYNKLGNRRFLQFTAPGSGTATIRADFNGTQGATATDPDLVLYAAGVERARAESPANGSETLSAAVTAGTRYVLEVYEFSNLDPSAGPGGRARGLSCFNVQLTLP
jgi:hypothetical protein